MNHDGPKACNRAFNITLKIRHLEKKSKDFDGNPCKAQLVSMRGALKEAEEDHVKQSSWTQRLGRELADARAGEQEAREQQAAQALELREASKRLSGGTFRGVSSRCQS